MTRPRSATRRIAPLRRRLLVLAGLASCAAGYAQEPPAGVPEDPPPPSTGPAPDTESPIVRRRVLEAQVRKNPFLILPHRPNYIQPVTYNDEPNDVRTAGREVEFDSYEAKFQISFKLPLVDDLLGDNGDVFFAYTQQSMWQVYNSALSAPFRDTTHEPEVFITFDTDLSLAGVHSRLLVLGFAHQSNGRSEPLSRSWNRIYLNFIVEHGRLALSFKPWYRIPEDEADDDNPDIERFMGRGELSAAYKLGSNVFSVTLRNTLDGDRNRGALDLAWTFPLGERLTGYAGYFKGFGETLLDYDREVHRLGVGIAMSTWL